MCQMRKETSSLDMQTHMGPTSTSHCGESAAAHLGRPGVCQYCIP